MGDILPDIELALHLQPQFENSALHLQRQIENLAHVFAATS
jgi:hypothetical protein